MAEGAPRRFKALLFDLYDTLIWLDAETSNRRRHEIAERAGVSLDVFSRAWRRSVDDRMLGRGGSLADHLAATVAMLGGAPDPALVADLEAMERSRLEECVHLYPSTVPVLRRLAAAGYRLGLLSNVSDGAALPITYLGVDRLFDDLVLSHEVGLLKPDPEIFALACRRLEAAPAEAAFVADGGFGELDAAYDLGIYSVKVVQDRQIRDFGSSSRYDAEIRDLDQLEELLKTLEGSDHR